MRFVAHLPRPIIIVITAVISFFFFLGAKPVRKNSRIYLEKLSKCKGTKQPSWVDCYKHVLCFSIQMFEKILSWMGKLEISNLKKNEGCQNLQDSLTSGHGAFLFCSHLGNIDMFRSLSDDGKQKGIKGLHVYPIVDFSGTSKFNNLLRELNPELMDHVIDAKNIGVDSVIWIKEKIDEGGLIVIAGDRTSPNTQNRTLTAPFLGEEANFPEGAFTLASVIGAPIYFGFGTRSKNFNLNSTYEFNIYKAKTQFTGTRKERKLQIRQLLEEYIALVENACEKHPYQWYNFYNFWNK
ncbi:MAG: lipid A biosynthesis acyltransferase [Fibrobacter sp.]|nr:lipid A biosynthesis acyltransferase [Fibrobacter sp.]